MNISETELTPELAAQLMGNPHPKQRRISRQIVEGYARAIREGRWRLIDDPLLVVGKTHAGPEDPEGSMFNGGHRCAAVLSAHRAIPVYIDWDADPTTFDLIDIGRKRNAAQFVGESFATTRSAAARLTLWYERRFDRPPTGVSLAFDLHEVLAEVERRNPVFDQLVILASRTFDYTGLSKGVALAAYTLASEFGYDLDVEEFVAGVCDPMDLEPTAPARLLAERFRRQGNRGRRRTTAEDWIILVRALNLHLQGISTTRLQMTECWPRVAESERDFNRRKNALRVQRERANKDAYSHKVLAAG